MPRSTEDILAHADELAARAEAYEPTDGDQARVTPEVHLRLAVLRRAEAESDIVESIANARECGVSWAKIGLELGTSGQSASERYGKLIAG